MKPMIGVVVVIMAAENVAAGGAVLVTGRVVDQHGKPVAGAKVADHWYVDQSLPLKSSSGARTDAEGRFSLTVQAGERDMVVMARDASERLGGLKLLPAKGADGPIEIKLGPLVEVRGRFGCQESGQEPSEAPFVIYLQPGELRLAEGRFRGPSFGMSLPVGTYQLMGGASARHVHAERDFTLAPGQGVDLGVIDLKLTPIGRLLGKEAPAWHVTDARGVSKDVRPADFKGKWVVIDFWGFWCGPCVGRSLPHWMDFAEAHAVDRDKFVILAIHDPQATDFAMLDQKLKPIVRGSWRGRELPFPILLDTTGRTVEEYGVTSWPTVVLIDPEGRVVDYPRAMDRDAETYLASKLTPLPNSDRIAWALDRDLGLFVHDDSTPAELVEFLGKMGRIKILLDREELGAAGVDERAPVPLLASGRLTLRAWLNLGLDAFGLTYVADGDGLRVVRRTPENDGLSRPSPRQARDNAQVAEVMAGGATFDFQGKTLPEVVETLKRKTGETFIIDPSARRHGAIKADVTATGTAADEPLGLALTRLLEPLGMTWFVRDEVVVLTIKR